jgi:hypothetical protein
LDSAPETSSIDVELLNVSQSDIRSATLQLREPSDRLRRYNESVGLPPPQPHPQVAITFSDRAARELNRATERYRNTPPTHSLRIERSGFEPIDATIVSLITGVTHMIQFSDREEAEKYLSMFTRGCR